LRSAEEAWKKAGVDTGFYSRGGPKSSYSYWKYSIVSEHPTKGAAQRAALKVAKDLKQKSESKYSKKILDEVGELLHSKLGKNQLSGRIGDLVTYADNTYGAGWLWEIVSEDNNSTSFREEKNMLTIRPIWTGMRTDLTLKNKEAYGHSCEPASLLELGETYAKLVDIIDRERKRKTGNE